MDPKYLEFELEDLTKIKLANNARLCRIGMRVDVYELRANKYIETRIETFYNLKPNEIKKIQKEYNGTIVYVVLME